MNIGNSLKETVLGFLPSPLVGEGLGEREGILQASAMA
jgi:hypothetical protein